MFHFNATSIRIKYYSCYSFKDVLKIKYTGFKIQLRQKVKSLLFCCLTLSLDSEVIVHVISGPDENRRSLVDGGRLNVQRGLLPVRGLASSLLNDVGHWIALVEQSKLLMAVGSKRRIDVREC